MKLILLIISFVPLCLFSQCWNLGTGVDGAFHATTDTSIVGATYQFTSFTIDTGVTVSVTGNVPLTIYSQGTTSIYGTLHVNGGNGTDGVTYTSGGTGGTGVAGGANGGEGVYSDNQGPLNGSDGANIGGANTYGAAWSGGGGAGYAAVGDSSGNPGGGNGGISYGDNDLTGFPAGSGGGGGSGGYGCGSGGGGAGGGTIVLYTNVLTIDSAGIISSNGGNGGSDGTGNCGGGGGGSGGSVFISAFDIVNDGIISVNGGIGGASAVPGNPYYGTGGNGSPGRIRIDHTNPISGTGTIVPGIGSDHLTMPVTSNQSITLCNGESLTVGSSTYFTSGTYQDVLSTASGCDSTVNTTLTILPAIQSSQSFTLCEGESITVGSSTYSSVGTYQDIFTAASGCDSTVNTTLTILPAIQSSQSFTLCEGESITVGSSTYSSAGTYQDIFTAASGCDSTVNTTLTILPAIQSSQSFTLCEGESITVGSSTYSSAGTYQDIFTAASGCDSTVTTTLSIQSINATVTNNSNTLTALSGTGTFQWIDCGNGNAPIAGETLNTYTPVSNGQYAVIITVNNCSDTSACQTISTVGLHEQNLFSVSVFPNPTNGNVTVEFGSQTAMINVTDLAGRVIRVIDACESGTVIDFGNEARGVYFLNIAIGSQIRTIKVTKQ